MDNNKLRDLEEIKKEIKEPEQEYIEKYAKISDDKKSLLLRIPQEIRNKFNMNAGDKLKFLAKFEDGKKTLKIEYIKC